MTDPKREGQGADELRNAVRTAWMTGTDDFRRHYDRELFAALGITSFQDLWPGRPQPRIPSNGGSNSEGESNG